MVFRLISLLFLSCLFCKLAQAAKAKSPLVNPKKSHVLQISKDNVQTRVLLKRNSQISAVLLCPAGKARKKCESLIEGEWNSVAQSLKGIIIAGAIDCEVDSPTCKSLHPSGKQVQEPTVVILPLFPLPTYEYTGEISSTAIRREITRYFPSDEITILSTENIHGFLSSFAILPKAILFTDKGGIPFIYRAISKSFTNKLKFGIVHSNVTDLVARWKVKSFPHLMVLREGSGPNHYSGEISYLQIFDWINSSLVMKYERIPEVTLDSNAELCFKTNKKGICVIYLKESATLNEEEIALLEDLKERYRPHLDDRGTDLRWMWMNVDLESEFKTLFDRSTYPSVVVFNPHRRMRYLSLEDGVEASKDSIQNLLDKVLGGGARFTPVPELPKFADRKTPKVAKKDTDEL
ncbi:putative thioredoxin [Cardiosporidium cionae]|uniref:Thioredoxin n=1 Tax=Cardiosporidium cionae TaxID=476202 RepID=A0ABQ7J6E3_9APIC|nr:putative thioredoxin [Cardiosporidium cionae]|eukprot:KAF8819549.1 putative thioredoxin [Cardiosporidium cionae]